MATAEQTVSAVLESTNKRYVVETGTSEDGTIRSGFTFNVGSQCTVGHWEAKGFAA